MATAKRTMHRFSIYTLQERLEDLLSEITNRAFPELLRETHQKLANAEKELKELGTPRQTAREQQQYLASIASKFQILVRATLNTDCSAHPAFNKNDLRLVTAAVNITDQFRTDFDNFGRTYLFESETKVEAPGIPELDRIIVVYWDIKSPKEGIMEWIGAVHQRSCGLDLGSLDHGVLLSVFRVILEALKIVCADTQVLQDVSSTILGDLCAKYLGGIDQATLLVNVERQLKPYTLNHYFNHNHQRSHSARITETLRPKAGLQMPREGYSNLLAIYLNDIADAVTNKSNTAHDTETIHDTLEAYYKVACKHFVDNVFSQAVDCKLLSGPENPLRLFSEQWVLCCTDRAAIQLELMDCNVPFPTVEHSQNAEWKLSTNASSPNKTASTNSKEITEVKRESLGNDVVRNQPSDKNFFLKRMVDQHPRVDVLIQIGEAKLHAGAKETEVDYAIWEVNQDLNIYRQDGPVVKTLQSVSSVEYSCKGRPVYKVKHNFSHTTCGFIGSRGDCSELHIHKVAVSRTSFTPQRDVNKIDFLYHVKWTKRVKRLAKEIGINLRTIYNGRKKKATAEDVGNWRSGHVEMKLSVHIVYTFFAMFSIKTNKGGATLKQLYQLRSYLELD
ncbi:hypothetical protein ColLi_10947 [Colletotrichum liriopes]|uniref:Dynamin stalk domain-containing protein n=1 Tax=Colletotrichum liriopes TaxID=708192 RepID=A0AA37GVL7_9PEZI|nr:hypothetical protein ColLi_10947 [Colletotrichum liriopes]